MPGRSTQDSRGKKSLHWVFAGAARDDEVSVGFGRGPNKKKTRKAVLSVSASIGLVGSKDPFARSPGARKTVRGPQRLAPGRFVIGSIG